MKNPQKPLHPQKPLRRPSFQFSLMGLMVAMFVIGAAAAAGYYLMRGEVVGGVPQSRLVGMLMMLAGPLLLMTVLSVLVALAARWNRN